MHKKIQAIAVFILVAALPACTLPASYSTQVPQDYPAYTSAAQTINAQLTEINLPTGTPAPVTASPVVEKTAAEIPTQTLPATSTPAPSDTPELSPSPAITDTPQPSPTLAPAGDSENPRDTLGEPDWQDTFNNAANWPVFSDEHVDMLVDNGQLEMTALYNDKWESWMLTSALLTDFYLEVSATPAECSGADRYGLLARAPSATQGYLFGFTCDGKFALRIWNGQNFLMLVPWTTHEAILKGPNQTNTLGFYALGQTLRVYANGKFLYEIADDEYASGSFGLFIGAFNTPGFSVSFSEVAYWELP